MHMGRVSGIHIHYGKQFVVWNHPVSGKNIGLDPDGSYVPGECEQITQSSDKMASPWRFEHVLPPYLVQNENWWERERYIYIYIFMHIIFIRCNVLLSYRQMTLYFWFVFIFRNPPVKVRFVPHITVWGSCFSLGSRRGSAPPPPPPPPPPPHSHWSLHSLTPSLPPSLTHSLTHCRLPSRGRRSTQSLLEELRRAWAPLGRGWLRVAGSTGSFLAAFRVAGAVQGASWRSCGARARLNQTQARHPVPWVPRLPHKTMVDVRLCHACHAKRLWMWDCATPATWNESGCHQVPRLPRTMPRRHARPGRA